MNKFDLELKRKIFLYADENNFYMSISFFVKIIKLILKTIGDFKDWREREWVEDDLHKSKKKNKIDIIRTYRITSELIKN
jgi:hypothetical protein